MTEGKDKDGKYLPGNQFWRHRSKHGADPKYETAAILMDACCEYFEWNERTPLFEDKIGFYEGSATHEPMEKMRAMTLDGLAIFLGIVPRTWREWRKDRPDLTPVMEWAEAVIKQQKFSGAAAGLLNANIIARDLGLADKVEKQMLDENGDKTNPNGVKTDAIVAAALALAMKANKPDGQ